MTDKRQKIGREIIKVSSVNHHLPSLIFFIKSTGLLSTFLFIFLFYGFKFMKQNTWFVTHHHWSLL